MYKNKMIRPARSMALLLLVLVMGCLSGCGADRMSITTMKESSEDVQEVSESVSGESQEEFIPEPATLWEMDSESVIVSSADRGTGSEGDAQHSIFVYICGAVKQEGVYELSEGSRVVDALELAGGLTEEAASGAVNQAELLYDGEKIYFPTAEELQGKNSGDISGLIYGDTSGTVTSGTDTSDEKGLVNINTADKDALMTLSGIGEKKAEDIIAYREEHGDFSDIKDIMNVKGIGQSVFDKIKSGITIR